MTSPKYNRTYHLPWSAGATNDDKIAKELGGLLNAPIVITEKIDGSNTSLEKEGCFSRSHAGMPTHSSFDMLKVLHASVSYKIAPDVQLFGEWCYAKHSIEYNELPGYFLLFGVRYLGDINSWDSWDGVKLWSQEITVPTVPVLFEGTIESEKQFRELTQSFMNQPSMCGGIREGIVVRRADGFIDDDFSHSVMKCVRANHVQTTEHWKNQEIVRNQLKVNSQ